MMSGVAPSAHGAASATPGRAASQRTSSQCPCARACKWIDGATATRRCQRRESRHASGSCLLTHTTLSWRESRAQRAAKQDETRETRPHRAAKQDRGWRTRPHLFDCDGNGRTAKLVGFGRGVDRRPARDEPLDLGQVARLARKPQAGLAGGPAAAGRRRRRRRRAAGPRRRAVARRRGAVRRVLLVRAVILLTRGVALAARRRDRERRSPLSRRGRRVRVVPRVVGVARAHFIPHDDPTTAGSSVRPEWHHQQQEWSNQNGDDAT